MVSGGVAVSRGLGSAAGGVSRGPGSAEGGISRGAGSEEGQGQQKGDGQQRAGSAEGLGQQRAGSAEGQACTRHPEGHPSRSVRSAWQPELVRGAGPPLRSGGWRSAVLFRRGLARERWLGQALAHRRAGKGPALGGWLPEPSAPSSGVCPGLRLWAPPPPADRGRLALGICWPEGTLNFIWRLQKGRPVLV